MMLLYQHKYVNHPNFEERKRLPEMIYWLDKRGAEVVASLEGSSLSEFTWRREPRWFQVEHDLAVNDFRLDLLEACHSAQDVTLETWVPESEFWAYLDTLPEFQVIGEAASGEEAVELVKEHIPDVVLMDLIMPGMDGVETTRRIKTISPRTQVVVLTSFHEDVHIFPALKAGAISYILKDMKMDKLVEALHRAVQGEVTLHPRVATRVL